MLNPDRDPGGAEQISPHDEDVGRRLWDIALNIATAGHDLNNLLTIVYGNLELLTLVQEDRPIAVELQLSMHALDRAITLMRSLLRGGVTEWSVEVSDVPVVVDETLRLARALWAEIPAFVLTTEMHPCSLAALSDQVVRRVVLNIIMNAVAAMSDGGHLHVTVRDDASWITVMVQDSGPGMSAELVAQITQPFIAHHAAGIGLGLTSCARLLRQHHGHMDITSVVGTGTTVLLRLPTVASERTASH